MDKVWKREVVWICIREEVCGLFFVSVLPCVLLLCFGAQWISMISLIYFHELEL